jgi:uncharacterized delta-60 repeat protein
MATRAAELQNLERVRARVAEATAEDSRTNALWMRFYSLGSGSGVDGNQLTLLVRGYIEGIPGMLSDLQAGIEDPANGARVKRLLDLATNAFLSTPAMPGESGLIGLLGNAYLVWQLISLAARNDPVPLPPELVSAHRLIASMLGPELAGRQDRIAESLMASATPGPASADASIAPGSFAVGLWREAPPPRVASVQAAPAPPASVRTNVFAEDGSDASLAGGLDPRFGQGGLVVTGVPEGEASALAVRANGSLVVAGKCANEGGTHSAVVAQYGPRGDLDVTFGRTGCIRLDRAYGTDAPVECAASALAVQEDGKIVVAGSVRQPPQLMSGFDDLFVARITADGRLDSSFGREGWLQLDAGMASGARGMLLEPDGSIVVTGYVRDATTGNGQVCLLRLTPAGRMAPSLGASGMALLPSEGWGEGIALIRQPNGKFVVLAKEGSGSNNRFTVWRVTSDGQPDPSFGDGGRVALELGTGSNEPRALVKQADGKYLVAGYLDPREYILLRLDAAGRLDATFGNGGVVSGLFEPPSAELRDKPASFGLALAVQDNGAILLGGSLTQRRVSTGFVGTMPTYDVDRAIALARFLPDGRLDTTFGREGTAIANLSDGIDELTALALQGDGIMGAGNSGRGLLVARFCRETSSPAAEAPPAPEPAAPRRWLDASFGGSGAAFTSFRIGAAEGRAIAVQPDGRIVVAGRVESPDGKSTYIAAARYESDGALDEEFGTDGRTIVDVEGASSEARGVALQEDGKIVVAGAILDRESGGLDFALVRLESDGRVDGSLGGGLVTTDLGGGTDDVPCGVAAGQDGKLVAVGYTADAAGGREGAPAGPAGELRKERFAVVRYEVDGRLDESFGRGGIATTSFPGDVARAQAVHVLAGGGILVAGFARNPSKDYGWDLAAARYRPDGSLDDSFGDSGLVLIDVERTNDLAYGLAVQPDGKILLAGAATGPGSEETRFLVVRLDADGKLDRSFSGNGTLLVRGFLGAAAEVALLPDGRVVAAGRAIVTEEGGRERVVRDQFAIVCCLPEGRLDPAFGTDGVLLVDLGGEADRASGVAVQDDGKIVAAGTTRAEASEFAVIRVAP